MRAAAIRTQGVDEEIAQSPPKIAAPANATQVVNSDEPFIALCQWRDLRAGRREFGNRSPKAAHVRSLWRCQPEMDRPRRRLVIDLQGSPRFRRKSAGAPQKTRRRREPPPCLAIRRAAPD